MAKRGEKNGKQPERVKVSYIGAPAVFKLEAACTLVNRAFGSFGCYIVGSAIERADWRDVDVRFILEDTEFEKLFPDAGAINLCRWEFDPRWLIVNIGIAGYLSQQSGLPIDFQIQPQSHANNAFGGRPRHAVGLTGRFK